MNAVIYARYSSERQTEASIEGQLKVCYDYAEKQGYTIIGEYIDRALTGRNTDRPQFLKMIKDSSKQEFQIVLVYQLDRFSRNRYDSATYKAKLKKNGVRVVSARENISDDASGILMESVLEGMAEYYSRELAQKVTRGMNLNAEKCLYNGGTVPFGYKIVDKKFVIDEHTAPYVKKIFEMYSTGNTIKEIITYLNARNIKTSTNTKFNYSSLHTMLHNRKYIGFYKFGDVEVKDGVPRLISDKLFEKVQRESLKNHKAPARAKAIEEYILTTKLFCGYCKEMMVGVSGTSGNKKKFCYYSCNKARRKLCNKKNVSKDYLEDLVVNQCRELLTDENILKIAKEVVKQSRKDDSYSEIEYLEKAINKLNKEKKNLMTTLKSCDIESVKQDIFSEIGNINEEIADFEKQMSEVKNNMVVVEETEVIFFLSKLKDGNINSLKYRKLLVNIFVNQIFLYDDKITFIFNTGKEPVTLPEKFLEEYEKEHKIRSDLQKTGSPRRNRLTNRVKRFLICFFEIFVLLSCSCGYICAIV